MFEWLREIGRKKVQFMPIEKAQKIRARLSLIYAALAWNLIGMSVYIAYKRNAPKDINDSVDYAKLLGIQNATVYKYSGFKKVSEYDIHLEQEEIDEFLKKPETDKAVE